MYKSIKSNKVPGQTAVPQLTDSVGNPGHWFAVPEHVRVLVVKP